MAANEPLSGNDGAFDRLVRQEEFILDATETLTQALVDSGVTKAELAKRLKRSPGFVSQVFGGGRNLTLRTISDITAALSLRPSLKLSSTSQAAPVVRADLDGAGISVASEQVCQERLEESGPNCPQTVV